MKVLLVSLLAMTMLLSGEADARNSGSGHAVRLPAASYQPKTPRGAAVQQIVRTWAMYSSQAYGTPAAIWAKSMQETFAQASLANIQRATKMQTFEGMMGALLGQSVSDDKIIDGYVRDLQAADSGKSMSSLASQPASLGSTANDLVYTMVTPCRILDTRNAVGYLQGGEIRNFFVHGGSFAGQGGIGSTCNIPADPSAVVINVVAVYPSADGWLSVFPLGSNTSSTSLNYTQGRITANEIIAKTTTGQPNDLSVMSQSNAHIVIDIVGYFMAPIATKLQCFNTTGSGISMGPFAKATVGGGNCSATGGDSYTAVGGRCGMTIGDGAIIESQTDDDMHICRFRSGPDGDVVGAFTRCCRIPGR